jgi:molybdopterin converting factor subunit 1
MATTAIYTILLFASVREAAGAESIRVELTCEQTATVERLREAIAAQCPVLAPWLPHARIAVNCAYAQGHESVAPEDEIALIPPVAGGR